MLTRCMISVIAILLFSSALIAQENDNSGIEDIKPFEFRALAELGFLAVLDHKVQFSKSGTYFDYKEDGGQNVLFPVSRLSLELDVKERNTFILLYQPLRLESEVLLQDDLIVDDLLFPASTAVKLLYNFPFYRLSYLRELLPNNPKYDFAVGGSLQIRNATISFESTDGTRFRTNRDIGLVPALKIRGKAQLSELVYAELEADGIYAPISYLNGSDNEVTGAILDANLRAGLEISDPVKSFLNFRYLGGGAVGTSDVENGVGDGYVKNWLHFLTVTAGFVYTFD